MGVGEGEGVFERMDFTEKTTEFFLIFGRSLCSVRKG
jgi:hypothetical protein